MSRDGSGRSSAAGSVHANSPELSPDPAEPEPQQSAKSSSTNAQTSAADVETKKTTTINDDPSRAAEPQPMTAPNSTTSHPSTKDAPVGSIASVPYGTRSSRNRTGAFRPNYAEDKELDAEFEVSSVRENNGRKGKQATEQANIDTSRPATNTRKAAEPEPAQSVPIQNITKDPIPGTSTFSAKPTPSNSTGSSSKKRKAPSQASTAQSQHQLQSHGSNTPKTNMATHYPGVLQDSNMLSFETCRARLNNRNQLVADDGTILEVNDHAYLVCEPPGEPYYLGRIMEFLHVKNDPAQPIDALRLNWYYRPKDIGRKVNDTRQVFASMHSDISPLTALRGKCHIKHKSEVEDLDELRKAKDSFWYEKLYDRYIHRYYDVIPTVQVINVPVEVKKVLDERWKYIIVEPGRGKELTSAVKTCKRCSKYCASNDSVDCAVCQNTYHMSCVSPPLLKKPSRGFAWACGPCSKAQEKKLEARNTPNITGSSHEAEEEEFNDEEAANTNTPSTATSSEVEISFNPGTAEQIHQASLWQFRYLGIHCKVEDALDYDDRIYPRASSRLGPRHQANIPDWPGRPVEYVKPMEIKRKYVKGGSHKKDSKLSKETLAAIEADKLAREKRPKWIMDEPVGYVHRGDDYDNDDPRNTAKLLYKFPEESETPEPIDEAGRERLIQAYMYEAVQLSQSNRMGFLPQLSTNLLDVALELLHENKFDARKALDALAASDPKVFKEPILSPAENKKFEDAVTKFGSEWYNIKKHVKTMSPADVVRYYYTWKKTDRGKQIWGNYHGRKGKREVKIAEVAVGKLQDDVADEHDDSAFDNEKARVKNRGFQCKFCNTRQSRQWRRAPNTAAGKLVPENPGGKTSGKDKGNQIMVALCRRCAELWRRYAIQWEDIDEVAKKVASAGGRAWKRKVDEELLKELQAANEIANHPGNFGPTASTSSNGTPAPTLPLLAQGAEPPKKKLKGSSDRDSMDLAADNGVAVAPVQKKKPIVEKPVPPPPPPPPPPDPPKAKILPCAICEQIEPIGEHLSCRDCRMAVHKNCYGVVGENRSPSKWVCDMCSNDKNPQVSIQYKCMLCPVEFTEHDFVEPPKISHKKKTEKDREKDRVEREKAQKDADYFRKKQEEMNKPVNPREPLKRTANNNWVHVTCAVFTPEVKFGNANALEPSEGIPSIPSSRYEETCKLCKKNRRGACVGCHSCKTPVHVECAHQGGWVLGFDIAPVKGSRRDQFNIVNINGEVGTMTAAVWCKDHLPTKTIVHRMEDIVDAETGLNALQLYVRNFKQADLTLTGTVRKATLVNQSTKVVGITSASQTQTTNRRASTTTGVNSGNSRGSILHSKSEDMESSDAKAEAERTCITCQVDVSPRWWPFPAEPPKKPNAATEGTFVTNGDHIINNEPPSANGHGAHDPLRENGESQIALAAAALHQDTPKIEPIPTEFQCHQCHWKGIRKEPSPPPPPPPAPPVLRESPRAIPIPSPAMHIPVQDPEPQPPPPIPYQWPAPPSYPPTAQSYSWPHRSPAPQSVGLAHHLNGNHSPRVAQSVPPPLNTQSTMRQSSHGMPHSPRQNSHMNQMTNGYPHPHPPSPHHGMRSPAMHMNGSYQSYVSSRPSTHHLTNGGPPPRPSEHPFSQNHAPPIHHRPSFGTPQGSPSTYNSHPPLSRDSSLHQNNGNRPSEDRDRRVNGGASASPSLRNLLS